MSVAIHARQLGTVEMDHTAEELEIVEEIESSAAQSDTKSKIANPKSIGTVGAVACDSQGRLAAATSTGGMTNKKFGRVGDTPLVGLGTYADDVCAVSGTGHGEFFMLSVTPVQ